MPAPLSLKAFPPICVDQCESVAGLFALHEIRSFTLLVS